MSETKIQTAEDLLPLLNQLPESEKILLLQRVIFSVPPQFDGENFTEIYKGSLIEVYRSEMYEEYRGGGEWWTYAYTNSEGRKVISDEYFKTIEESLKVARAVVAWEIEQEDICNQSAKLIQQFETKGYTQAGILFGFCDALSRANWSNEVCLLLEKAVELLELPGRILP